MEDLTGARWRKSSYSSGGQNGSCVEVAGVCPAAIAVRDSKDPAGPVLAFTPREWKTFTANIKTGGFDGLI